MTKDEKAQFTRMLEILERIEARMNEHEISPAIGAALAADPDDEVCIDSVATETSPDVAAAVNANPVTEEEIGNLNAWLVQIANYLNDRGALVRRVLWEMGLKGVTEIGDNRALFDELVNRVNADVAKGVPSA